VSYISNADIEQRIGHLAYVQLTDDAGTGSANEDIVTEARLGAEGQMDSYLGRRYAVPVVLSDYPELAGVLKSAALDLAEYRLHARRSTAPAEVKAKHEAALGWLRRIAAGEAVLPTAGEAALNAAAGFAGLAAGAERVLTRESMEGL
jgi:phage gp36-like protein